MPGATSISLSAATSFHSRSTPAARQPGRLAVVEVAQDLGRVEAVGGVVDGLACAEGRAAPCRRRAAISPPRPTLAVGALGASPLRRRARRARPGAGTVSCSSASVGAATTPPASSRRRLIPRSALRRLSRSCLAPHKRDFDRSKPVLATACHNRSMESADRGRARRPVPGRCARAPGCSSARRRRVLEVAGAEAGEYLQGQLTNDVEALEPGEGCYSALLDRKGHMQGDMRVLRIDRRLRHRHRGRRRRRGAAPPRHVQGRSRRRRSRTSPASARWSR